MDREEQIKLFIQKAKKAGATKEQTFAAIKRKYPDYFVSEDKQQSENQQETEQPKEEVKEEPKKSFLEEMFPKENGEDKEDFENEEPVAKRSNAGERIEGAIRNFTSGATMGFQDELSGVGGAIGGMIADKLSGKDISWDSIKKDYRESRDLARESQKKFQDENPISSVGLQLAGGVSSAGFLPKGGNVVGTLNKIKASAKTGALLGAIATFGESKELKDIPEQITGSAFMGATVSGAMTGAGIGMSKAFKSLGGILSRNQKIKNLFGQETLNELEQKMVSGNITNLNEAQSFLLSKAENQLRLRRLLSEDKNFSKSLKDTISKTLSKTKKKIATNLSDIATKESDDVINNVFEKQRFDKGSINATEDGLAELYGMERTSNGFTTNEKYKEMAEQGLKKAKEFIPVEKVRNTSNEIKDYIANDSIIYDNLLNNVSGNTFNINNYTQYEAQRIEELAAELAQKRGFPDVVSNIETSKAKEIVNKEKFEKIVRYGTDKIEDLIDMKNFVTERMGNKLKDLGYDVTKFKKGVNDLLREIPEEAAILNSKANFDKANYVRSLAKNINIEKSTSSITDLADNLKTDGILDFNKLTGAKIGLLSKYEEEAIVGNAPKVEQAIRELSDKIGGEQGKDFFKNMMTQINKMQPEIDALRSINSLFNSSKNLGKEPFSESLWAGKTTLAFIKNASTIMWNSVLTGIDKMMYGVETKKAISALANASDFNSQLKILKQYTNKDPLVKKQLGKALQMFIVDKAVKKNNNQGEE